MSKFDNEMIGNISKFFKYASLIEAEIISKVAKKIHNDTETFVKKYSDREYEQNISDIFNGFEKTMEAFAPKIEKVKTSVSKVIDFSAFKKNA